MKRARYTPKARQDLDEIAEYIAADNLDAAIRFCLAIEDAAEKLAEMPGLGTARQFANPMAARVRSWIVRGFGNYIIFYQPVDDEVEIVRIIHGARDIDTIFEEP